MTSEPEVFTAWITKYALTPRIGTLKRSVTLCGNYDAVRDDTKGPFLVEFYFGEGKNWHRTPSSALARAEEMRQAKIKSLRAQIEKLEKMEFKAE